MDKITILESTAKRVVELCEKFDDFNEDDYESAATLVFELAEQIKPQIKK